MPTSTVDAVFETHLSFQGRRQGKVRDVYDLPSTDAPRLLLVATDRVSAFDVVMPTALPGKGRILTAIASAWFDFLRARAFVGDHVISTDVPPLPPADADMKSALEGRVMVCRAAKVVPIECVVRGYLAGSAWSEYQEAGTACSIRLPARLTQCEQLPTPIFTPATKESHGHDENISFDRGCALVGGDLMERLRDLSLKIYTAAATHALSRGLILADTKFEFGYALDRHGAPTDELLIVDEVLTPDSSIDWWKVSGWFRCRGESFSRA